MGRSIRPDICSALARTRGELEARVKMDISVAGFSPIATYAPDTRIPGGSETGVLGRKGLQAWRHLASGVRVVLFSAPGPLVSACIMVGTAAVSDCGEAHTLEHIVFLGSEKYPQRGYLDNLACRCLADGTNAWTENEYTAYTTSCAGFEGMETLLPCFLDHVLRPKINDASFASEVYHVRGDGKEAGVVFCEMQGRENTEGDLSDRALRAALLAGTPLARECGGLCGDIRKLTNDDIQRFHADQYCGANITVVVGGSGIAPNSLLSSLQPLLDEIAGATGYSPGKAMWNEPLRLQPLVGVQKLKVPFPCPDEDIGTVILGWRGPGASDRIRNIAIGVLLRYLAADVWSPLRQRFVETDEQIASDIYHSQDLFLEVSTISLVFSGVPHREDDECTDNDMNDVEEQSSADVGLEEDFAAADADGLSDGTVENISLLASEEFGNMAMTFLTELVQKGELPGGLVAVRAALKREKEAYLADLESTSHEAVPHHLIEEVLYAETLGLSIGDELRGYLGRVATLDTMGETYWLQLLKETFLDGPRVEITMIPDPSLAEKHAEDEARTHAERVAEHGERALSEIGATNEARIASLKAEVFDSEMFPPMPSTMNVSRWPYKVDVECRKDYFAQSVSIDTDFVHVTILFDTASFTFEQRMILPLLCDMLLSSDVLLEDGSYLSYTDSAQAISEATVSTDHSGEFLGYGDAMAHQCVGIHFATMPDNIAEAVGLVMQALFGGEVSGERLATVSHTMMSSVTESMREGPAVLSATVAALPHILSDPPRETDLPNYVLMSTIGVHPLLSFLTEEFSRKKPKKTVRRKVLRLIQNTWDALRCLPQSAVFVQVAAREPEPAHEILSTVWGKHRGSRKLRGKTPIVVEAINVETAPPLPISRRLCSPISELLPAGCAKIIGIPGVESCFVDIRVDSPVFAGHADWSALVVLSEMLCRMEGPLSNAVRGAGLAYGVYLGNSSWRGHLIASLDESSAPASAWDAMCETLDTFRTALEMEPKESGLAVELDTSKAATLYSLNRGRSTPESIAIGALSRTALGAPASPLADHALEEAIESVTLEAIASAYDKHVARLCQPAARLVTVTCNPSMVVDTIATFGNCSRPIALQECKVEELYLPGMQKAVDSLKR